MRFVATAGILCLALTAACGSSSNGPADPGSGLANGSFAATVDGTSFVSTGAAVQEVGNTIAVAGTNAAGHTLTLTWIKNGTGTLSAALQGGVVATYTFGNNAWIAGHGSGTGTTVVTTLSGSRVAGTFNFDLVAVSAGTVGGKTISNGSFDLAY
jgi:hypothetical protein